MLLCCRLIFVVVSAITPPWLDSVVINFEGGRERGHCECFDALVVKIPTLFATLVPASMLVSL